MKVKSKMRYSVNEDLSKYKDLMLIAAFSKYFEKIDALEEKLNTIESKLDMMLKERGYEVNENVIVVKEIPYEQAKREVINYFKIHKQATIIDLHRDLGIPLDTLVEIIDELFREGIIGD